ncbi:class I SAM-dependent methyltransferase [Falsiroseomonas sp. HW251]|uniref:class I SAM-dependent methyltransferase n=1 Tax=Falsiroseomonas sp. HW251 TaxID=3390998 RepID=UPI003D31DA9C
MTPPAPKPPAAKPPGAKRRAVVIEARRQAGRAVAAPSLTRDEVLEAYRWILGRAPENEAVVAKRIASGETPAMLRAAMLSCTEFRNLALRARPAPMPLDAAPPAIGLEADGDQIAAMLAQVKRVWTRLAEVSPFALPDGAGALAAAPRAAFLASGLEDRAMVEAALARCGVDRGRLLRAVDQGCGAGRATLHLAAICPEVTGVDVSAPHLAAAAALAREKGLAHLRWQRVGAERLAPGGPCDLWFSRGALQHSPPPLARAVLAEGFASVAPGGVAVVQLLTWGADYAFSAEAYLASPRPPRPEWHVVPMAEVLALAATAGLVAAEVLEDPVPALDRARWLSHLFVLRRPG